MSWSGSTRRATLPPNWRQLRAQILRRDSTCRLGYDCCTVTSAEVDHIGEPTDHRPMMLRGVCGPCHKRRTAQQAADAKPRATRPPERHPGLL